MIVILIHTCFSPVFKVTIIIFKVASTRVIACSWQLFHTLNKMKKSYTLVLTRKHFHVIIKAAEYVVWWKPSERLALCWKRVRWKWYGTACGIWIESRVKRSGGTVRTILFVHTPNKPYGLFGVFLIFSNMKKEGIILCSLWLLKGKRPSALMHP